MPPRAFNSDVLSLGCFFFFLVVFGVAKYKLKLQIFVFFCKNSYKLPLNKINLNQKETCENLTLSHICLIDKLKMLLSPTYFCLSILFLKSNKYHYLSLQYVLIKTCKTDEYVPYKREKRNQLYNTCGIHTH